MLKLVLDFVVRENSCLEFKAEWRRWVGRKSVSAQFMAPGSRDAPTGTKRRWPEARKGGVQSRIVRLIADACDIDPNSEAGVDHLNGVLRAAWDDLARVRLLQVASGGCYLALEDLSFSPITNAWLCPVTRRVLDTTWRGFTPYLPGQQRKAMSVTCEPIVIPSWSGINDVFPADGAARTEAARAWLSSDTQVIALRELGVWSNLNDRIVEGVRYFRTAEHSAQQSGERLKSYTEAFKSGQINLLSCSTTMEMGVDIGGIGVVAMNNVPPHPANYLQRVGRAGRRSETRSVGLTMCKANPHDQQVFSNPLWAFTTQLPAPSISLESPVIVQRHVNAMLLADYLWQQVRGDASLEKLTMEWWCLPATETSQADRFVAWARCFDPEKAADLAAGVRRLLRGTCFGSGEAVVKLAADAASAMDTLLTEWRTEVARIDEQLAKFSGAKEKEPAFRALDIQKKRLTQEYLLRELATGGFLPGYGFPTNITAFDTLNLDEINRLKSIKGEGGREDNRLRRRELPSRDAVTALREYAPGADVVIDGTVYRSSGITLNWHAPASQASVKEIQSIRRAWSCTHCGASGTAVASDDLYNCRSCGHELEPSRVFTYLQPSGFAVDLYESTHTDVADTSYVPVEDPWINAVGDWLPLANSQLGRFRSSTQGKVFNRSSGLARRGYAICLECGRAAPMPAFHDAAAPLTVRELPKVFHQPHKRLRGAQGGDTAICAGSLKPYAIKPNVFLGIEETTDVLELQLNHVSGLPLSNRVAAYSIAVALRNAVAAELGVESEEIGCAVKPIRLPAGQVAEAIVLFDHAAAGYCSSVAERLPDLLRLAKDRFLNCKAGCHAACQHCLAGYDTRFQLDNLDRTQALEFLSEEWLGSLQLPVDQQYFGARASWAESQPMIEAITREWCRHGSTELRIFFDGAPADWDFAASVFRRALEQWAISGQHQGVIRLVMSASAWGALDADQRWSLFRAADLSGVTVHTLPAMPANQVAQVQTREHLVAWACGSPGLAAPGSRWAQPCSSPLVRGHVAPLVELSDPLSFAVAAPEALPPTAGRVEIRGALAKDAISLGPVLLYRVSAAMSGPLLAGEARVESVVYRDRYLNAPLPVSLLVSFLKALKKAAGSRWEDPKLAVITTDLPKDERYQASSQVFHNWQDAEVRNGAILQALRACSARADVIEMPKHQASHARTMEIRLEDGKKVRLWFDQGFGYWTSPRPSTSGNVRSGRSNWFRFDEAPSAQGERIAAGGFDIEGQSFPTHIFFELE